MKPIQKKKDDSDYIVKVVIIGDSGVGKTNILVRFCDNQFKASYSATIGVDFKIKVVQVDGKKIKLQIWDTAGQERYKNINQTYYRGAIGIILTYSMIDSSSFTSVCTSFLSVESWLKQIHEHASTSVIKFLVANKVDLSGDRKVEREAGKKLADRYGMTFIEVSAKDGTNINQLFHSLGEEIYEQIKTQDQKDNGRLSLTHQNHQASSEKSCKC